MLFERPLHSMQPRMETLESIQDLTSKDIKKILEHSSDEQKAKVTELVEMMNQKHAEQIRRNEARIEREIQISQILLKKCWRGLDRKMKQECAAVFKEIWDKIVEHR